MLSAPPKEIRDGGVDDARGEARLKKINETAGEDGLSELVDWAQPIQERRFSEARECSLKLAGEKDPYDES